MGQVFEEEEERKKNSIIKNELYQNRIINPSEFIMFLFELWLFFGEIPSKISATNEIETKHVFPNFYRKVLYRREFSVPLGGMSQVYM